MNPTHAVYSKMTMDGSGISMASSNNEYTLNIGSNSIMFNPNRTNIMVFNPPKGNNKLPIGQIYVDKDGILRVSNGSNGFLKGNS
jgi:hypothetical protein